MEKPYLLVVSMFAALTLGACGDDSDGGDTPTTVAADEHAAEHEADGDHADHAEDGGTPTTLSADVEHAADHDSGGDHEDH